MNLQPHAPTRRLISGAEATHAMRRLRKRYCGFPAGNNSLHPGLSFTHPTGGEFGGSTFTPASRNPVLWYRSDAANVTLVSNAVSSWASIGSNTQAVTQGTSADRPGYTATNSSWNNRPTLNYTSTSMQLNAVSFTQAQPCSLYVFGAITTGGTSWLVSSTCEAGLDGADFYFYDGAIHTASTGNGNPHAFCVVFNGSSGALYVDNSSTALATGSGSIGYSSSLSIGNSMTGTIVEVVLYAGADTAAQRSQMFVYGTNLYKAFTAS